MVLAHRERVTAAATQRELIASAVPSADRAAPLPGPGVYARHNAVDTPALLPDGTPSRRLSVPRVAGRDRRRRAGRAAARRARSTDAATHRRPERGTA